MISVKDEISVQLAIYGCVAAGNKEETYRLMERHYRPRLLERARRMSLAYVLNDAERTEAIHKAFDDVYDRLSAGEEVSSLFHYLYAFVRNKLLNTNRVLKRFYRRQRPLEASTLAYGEEDQRIAELQGTPDDRLHAITVALGRLGKVCRTVIRLKKLENKSHAAIVGLLPELGSASASAKRLQRCMVQLKSLVAA